MKELDWLTIKQLIDTEIAKIVYKALHNEAPECVKEIFHRLSDTQSMELRNSKTDLYIPLLRTSSGQKDLPTAEYVFGITFLMRQKQSTHSRLLKQN